MGLYSIKVSSCYVDLAALMNFVSLAVELFGIKSITTASIQADIDGCEQPVGWFNQLDPQWNITQCVQDKVIYI